MANFTEPDHVILNVYGNTKDCEFQNKLGKNKALGFKHPDFNYTTKLQQSKQNGTSTKADT